MGEFRQAERDYNAHLAEQRRIRQERSMEEREKRQQEYDLRRLAREAEKLDDQPYVGEITLIEQTILFCKGLQTTKNTEQKETKKETKIDIPDGTEILLKKEDRDEFYFAPLKTKNKSKKAGKAASDGPKPIKHNAETFRLFDQLKLDAPITTDDIPPVLEKLEEQLESYQAKVKVWEEKREEMKRRILAGGKVEEDADEAAEGADGEKEEKKEEDAADEKADD